ncbi:MAG: DUF2163 domain-containing protein [Novosphingobium sp.]
MTRVWFSEPLETVATFWRVARKDGVTLGFTTHDRDLWFDGVLHRAVPGMLPSAIRRSADLEPDSAEVEGALSHESISSEDLSAGRFDGARVAIGVVDWQSLDRHVLYRGAIGQIEEEDGKFNAELVSRKAELQRDPVPRTSPTCRAAFCGPGCGLSAQRFMQEIAIASSDTRRNAVRLPTAVLPSVYQHGSLRWLDGPLAGMTAQIAEVEGDELFLATALDVGPATGTRILLREGCDRTIATCGSRFGNAANFQGEPYLPGNDLIARYPTPQT